MSGRIIPFQRATPALHDRSDAELIAACGGRDPAALGALFDRHHATIHRFLVRMAGVDDHGVDDLVQETFIQLYEGAGSFRGEASARAWMLGIAANLARRHVRTDLRRKSRAAAFLERLTGLLRRPDEELERRELAQRMEAALADLPHDLRVAFVLCDVEEVRGVDAAQALGVKEGTLYRRLHDARRRLRAALGDEP